MWYRGFVPSKPFHWEADTTLVLEYRTGVAYPIVLWVSQAYNRHCIVYVKDITLFRSFATKRDFGDDYG